jgi:CP family cyanate transporter-like MFS transporter
MSRGHILVAIGLLWLAGAALRLPILAVPPVLTTMQSDLAMSGTEVGILSGLPVIVFALVSLPGSLLIARIGAVPALVAGLLIGAVGTLLRGGVSTVLTLYAATAIMGAGIAIMQPALPAVVRQWLPDRVGFATAVFTNGLIVGEFVPILLMVPLVLPLTNGSWQWALATWALPLVVIAGLIAVLAPRPQGMAAPAGFQRPRWWPDWRSSLVWRLALILGSANSAYFSANAFIPAHLEGVGRAELIGPALSALNVGQLPASLLLLAVTERLLRGPWPLVAIGLANIVCVIGIVSTASAWTVVFATALGFFAAAILVLALALPPLLLPPEDVARTSAAMFAIGYTEAVLTAVAGGVLWDMLGSPAFAFVPIVLVLVPLILLPAGIDYGKRFAGPGENRRLRKGDPARP